jgi:ribonuclease P protein component
MLAKKFRFHSRHDLAALYRSGRTLRGNGLSVRYKSNQLDHFRSSVVVSKKVAKSAVTRNRIRRRVYEILRSSIPPATPIDLIVTVFDAKLAVMPATELKQLLQPLLEKLPLTTSRK